MVVGGGVVVRRGVVVGGGVESLTDVSGRASNEAKIHTRRKTNVLCISRILKEKAVIDVIV